MSHPNRVKGIAFQRDVARFFEAAGFVGVESRAQHGNHDKGDLINVPDWTLELKNTQVIDLAGAVDEARVEAINAGTLMYAAIVKRRRRSIGEAYFVLPLALAVKLLGPESQILALAVKSPTEEP